MRQEIELLRCVFTQNAVFSKVENSGNISNIQFMFIVHIPFKVRDHI